MEVKLENLPGLTSSTLSVLASFAFGFGFRSLMLIIRFWFWFSLYNFKAKVNEISIGKNQK